MSGGYNAGLKRGREGCFVTVGLIILIVAIIWGIVLLLYPFVIHIQIERL
jgi:hypothetical protein